MATSSSRPVDEERVKEATDRLLTYPDRYVGIDGTYADGYLDALLDLLKELGLLHPDISYELLRREMLRHKEDSRERD